MSLQRIFGKQDYEPTVSEACEQLKKNRIIAFPTDTIYGLLATYSQENAKSLHLLRARGEEKPFIVLFPDRKEYRTGGLAFEKFVDLEKIRKEHHFFLEENIPGKNTFILPKAGDCPYPSGTTIAVRYPAESDNPALAALLQCAGPLLAPSLNPPGENPAKTMTEAWNYFGESIDYFFLEKEGEGEVSEASRIYDLTGSQILRLR